MNNQEPEKHEWWRTIGINGVNFRVFIPRKEEAENAAMGELVFVKTAQQVKSLIQEDLGAALLSYLNLVHPEDLGKVYLLPVKDFVATMEHLSNKLSE